MKTTKTLTVTGNDALALAELTGMALDKYADPTEEAREGLDLEEARRVAVEDQGLLFRGVSAQGLEAEERDGRMVVVDPDGGVWWPDFEAASALELAEDPEDFAVALCVVAPTLGRWKQ